MSRVPEEGVSFNQEHLLFSSELGGKLRFVQKQINEEEVWGEGENIIGGASAAVLSYFCEVEDKII